MNMIELSSGVYTTDAPVVACDKRILAFLHRQCQTAPKQRARFCAHRRNDQPVHEMLVAISKESYLRPHRHLHKSESFHVIEGTADILLYDDYGVIQQIIHMAPLESEETFFFRIEAPYYHSIRVTSDVFVIHATTLGPFEKDASEYAEWAPDELDNKAGRAFLLKQVQAFEKTHAET